VLLAGANNSGKTALLSALDLVVRGAVPTTPRHAAAVEPARVRARFVLSEQEQNQLVAKYGASRPTIRRALRELELRGLIQTRQGKGRFVRMPSPIAITLTAENYRRHQREGRRGFDAQVREQGHTPHQEIIEVAPIAAPPEVAERLGIEAGATVVMRRLRFVVDDQPVQLVMVYYDPSLVAGSRLEQPVLIPDGVHAELRRLGVQVTRFVEDFQGARLPNADEKRTLQLPNGVPVTRNIRTAYAGDQPVEVMDTISNGEVVAYRFAIDVGALPHQEA
jgi:GntR family transcriptional regulator